MSARTVVQLTEEDPGRRVVAGLVGYKAQAVSGGRS